MAQPGGTCTATGFPPASAEAINAAKARGQLVVRRRAFVGASTGLDATRIVQFRPVQTDQIDTIPASLIVDCRGIRRDPEHNATPLVKNLLDRGLARIDPLRHGLNVSIACRLINQGGEACTRIRVIGPASRAAFWEITAIPDIREQTHMLAASLQTSGLACNQSGWSGVYGEGNSGARAPWSHDARRRDSLPDSAVRCRPLACEFQPIRETMRGRSGFALDISSRMVSL